MTSKKKRLQIIIQPLAAAALMVLTTAAQAGVVYNWSPISAPPVLEGTAGRIEITDRAWRRGNLYEIYSEGMPFKTSLLDLEFTGVDGSGHDIRIMPRKFLSNPDADVGIFYDLDLTFNGRDPLSGSLDAGDQFDTIVDFSGGPVWTLADFASDDGTCFIDEPSCSGLTGIWNIDPTTIPTGSSTSVAEPSPLLLFAGGVLLAGLAWRRRAQV